MTDPDRNDSFRERRTRPRTPVMSEYMMAFLFRGSPCYQLKLRDISETGAGVVVLPQSQILTLIATGQEVNIRLVTPRGSPFRAGGYRGRVTQINDITEGKYRGHKLVGIELVAEE